MKVLITGGAGFIGSHLAQALLARGDAVVALDNFDPFYPRAIKEANVAECTQNSAFTLVDGDIRSAVDLDKAFQAGGAPDVVVHLAALAGVRPSVEDPARYQDVNVGGTTQVLEAMRRHGVKKLVMASSSSVYGNNEKVPFSEDDPVDFPISPYAATKRATELIAHSYHHLFDLDIFALRFFTVYGPRQRPDLAIHKFARLMLAGDALTLYGDGTTRRDYTYIDDILQGVLASIDNVQGFRIYNLGESDTISLSVLVETLAQALGVTPQINRLPLQPGDVQQTYADISRARAELGYAPTTRITEGIPRFVAWLRPSSDG